MAGNQKYWINGLPEFGLTGTGDQKYWINGLPIADLTETTQTLTCSSILSAETFSQPSVLLYLTYIDPTGISSQESFGSSYVGLLRMFLDCSGMAGAEAFGQPRLALVLGNCGAIYDVHTILPQVVAGGQGWPPEYPPLSAQKIEAPLRAIIRVRMPYAVVTETKRVATFPLLVQEEEADGLS